MPIERDKQTLRENNHWPHRDAHERDRPSSVRRSVRVSKRSFNDGCPEQSAADIHGKSSSRGEGPGGESRRDQRVQLTAMGSRALRLHSVSVYLRNIVWGYLQDRSITFTTKNSERRTRRVVCGVPQGSVLGFIL